MGLILLIIGLIIYDSDYTLKTIQKKFKKEKKILNEKQLQRKRRERKNMLSLCGIIMAFCILIGAFPFLFLHKQVEIRQDAVVYYNIFGNEKRKISLDSVETINISVTLSTGRGSYYYLQYELVFNDGSSLKTTRNQSFESGGYRDGYYSMMELHEQIKEHAVVTVEGLDKLDLFISDPELVDALYRCFSDL